MPYVLALEEEGKLAKAAHMAVMIRQIHSLERSNMKEPPERTWIEDRAELDHYIVYLSSSSRNVVPREMLEADDPRLWYLHWGIQRGHPYVLNFLEYKGIEALLS